MRATDNTTEWVKIGHVKHLSFIGKDIICYGNGCYLNFINITTGEESIFTVNRHCVNGDGIRVIRGHRSISIFAYAENCKNAVLHVKTYPDFNTVVKFTDGPPEGYSNLTFSETSLLITVSDLPHFSTTVWNWRRGVKMTEMTGQIILEDQIIRCSWGKPITVVQLGIRTDKLLLWDVFPCCGRALLVKRDVKFPSASENPNFRDLTLTTEGGIFLVDVKGCVYTFDSEACIEQVIEVNLKGDVPTSLCSYKGGLIVSGPNKEMRHYKKFGQWTCDWTSTLSIGIKDLYCNRSDFIIGVTADEEVIKISPPNEEIVYLKRNESKFDDICLIYPTGEHIVALCKSKFLNVYSVKTGQMVSNFELDDQALAIAENPEFPYVAVGYKTGLIKLISLYKPEKPSVIVSFHLTHNPIGNINFFENGRIIVAGFMDIGELFIIEGIPGTEMKVITSVTTNCQLVDYMLVGSRSCYRLFVIPVTAKYLAGNKIIRYCIMGKDNINVKEYEFENSNIQYYRLIPITDINRDRTFYALPFASRCIHVVETKRGDDFARVISEIKTGHQMRRFNLNITKYHAVTWGYDGFTFARDNNFERRVGMVLTHHRYLRGTRKAYVDPLEKYIITLGRDNILVCTNLVENMEDPERKSELELLQNSTKYALMFKRPTIGFKPEDRFEGKTWLEVQSLMQMEKEEEICQVDKQIILQELNDIKTILVDLVTKNLEGPENERLDLTEFYLDTALYNQKKQKNKEDCKNTEIYLKALIVAQDKVTNYTIKTYWEPMGIQGRIIRGIFANTMATKYTLLPYSQQKMDELERVEEQRKIEKFLSHRDSFEPWLIISPDKLLERFENPAKIIATDEYTSLAAMKALDVPDSVVQRSVETHVAINGTVAFLFIELCTGHYNQRQLTTFYQCELEQAIINEIEVTKLKVCYNATFDELLAQKRKEVSYIKDKHARLRHIISEYNYFSDNKISINIVDPQWTQEEEPELITKVFDHELSVTPYISPSEQAILDARAAEEERLRLALLADDFRERALMAMMNGVLEVRWEDELKKDVPVPKCVLEKDPQQFTEEDLRTIRDYEEKVAFLTSERERYKNMLDVEFSKVATNVRDTIRKFNQKVKDSVAFKMQIDSGNNHENLRINRLRVIQNERVKLTDKEKETLQTIKENEIKIDWKIKTTARLNEMLNECRALLETLQGKEKLLEKAFKRDIQEMSPIVQEQAIKIYRRRPRMILRHANFYSIQNEIAKSIITQETSNLVLTSECLEYLKAVDQLDHLAGLPPMMDEHTYVLVCKHRRLRMEFEHKLRAAQFQISDGELAIATFQRRIAHRKETIAKMQAQLQQVRTDYLNLMHNLQTQFVLRRGLVEIPLTGDVNDFKDAMLVPRKEIENINNLIKEAGNKKVQTIIHNMAFRRNIMTSEWEHQQLRLQINDLIEQLNDINNTKFTKEMQQYLKGKKMGNRKDVDSFETEVELLATTFENQIRDKREKYMKIRKQINAFKEHNTALDNSIREINIDVCDLKYQKDDQLECKKNEILQSRMDALLKRSSLVEQIQQNHNEILVLQTELELLRLKTYPTFKYKLIESD